MYTLRLFPHGALVAVVVLACVPPAQGQWSRDFGAGTFIMGDGTLIDPSGTTGMILYDPVYEATGHTVHEVWNSLVNESVRIGFNGLNDANDSGLMIDIDLVTQAPRVPTGSVSAKVLIRYSTNPLLSSTPTNSELNAGWLLRVDLANLNGYICVMDDRGYLQLQKLTAGTAASMCTTGNRTVPGFDITILDPPADWWVRFEVIDNPDNTTTVRAHAWLDGTPEPNDCADWTLNGVQCIDSSPLPDGAAALLVNEDENIAQTNFIDMDNASISSEITCVEICNNQVDDDGDTLADCADPDCDFIPGCVCNNPFADADGDGDVDQADFALLQVCFTGEGDPKGQFDPVHCNCFDREDVDQDGHFRPSIDGDSDVDPAELDLFEACASGAGIPADPNCDGN